MGMIWRSGRFLFFFSLFSVSSGFIFFLRGIGRNYDTWCSLLLYFLPSFSGFYILCAFRIFIFLRSVVYTYLFGPGMGEDEDEEEGGVHRPRGGVVCV